MFVSELRANRSSKERFSTVEWTSETSNVADRVTGIRKVDLRQRERTNDLPDRTQRDDHPQPGERDFGTRRKAYLPNTKRSKPMIRLIRITDSWHFHQTFSWKFDRIWSDSHRGYSISIDRKG